jgi:copper oxidase (laccase) domain-containing protein
VETLHEQYGCRPENLLVGIGPSISGDRYQVGPEVIQQVVESFGEDSDALIRSGPAGSTFDLWEANRLTLVQAGVEADHIQSAKICTAENTQDWYSHRAERGKTGRFGVLMALK